MRILHTSDWHLGRQFHNVSMLDDQAFILNELLQYLKHHPVDVLIIAGDIYDRSVPPADAVSLLNKVLNELVVLEITVILISGNHDGAQRLGFLSQPLETSGIHIISSLEQMTQPIRIESNGQVVDFYGIPYVDPIEVSEFLGIKCESYQHAHEQLVDQIDNVRDDAAVNMLICHAFIAGASESESERPLSIGGADQVSASCLASFDYVALGHLHQPQRVGFDHVRYSGSLLPYSFSEVNHKKSMTLIKVERDELSLDVVTLKAKRGMRIIEGEFNDILAAAKTDPHADDFLLIRLKDKHAIMDAMGQLSQYYGNLLHIERNQNNTAQMDASSVKQHLTRSELDLFADFFQQIHEQDLNEQQLNHVAKIIDRLKQQS